MKLVILAAGRGSRLAPITDNTPKALLKFEYKTLTELLIEPFVAAGIDEVVLCVGYKADEIAQALGKECCGVPIRYVFNPRFYETGAGYSLKLASGLWSHSDCIIAEGDQLIHPEIAKMLVDSSNCSILVDSITKPEYVEETVVVGREGAVQGIVWPAKHVPEALKPDVVGEAIVMAKIPKRLSKMLSLSLDVGEIISPLCQVVSNYIDVKGLPWIEIDTLTDLRKADKIYKEIYG